jgi:REP element-mobilizing transposase RayT
MPRSARLDAPGVLHHIIIRGIERRPIFKDNKDRDNLLNRLSILLPRTKTLCYAWALMPNHAHFLLRSGEAGISYLMRRLLTGYAVYFNRRHDRHGQLFQNRYKSIICQEDAYFRELVRYIHLNPVRAEVVKDLSNLSTYEVCAFLFRKENFYSSKAISKLYPRWTRPGPEARADRGWFDSQSWGLGRIEKCTLERRSTHQKR